MKIKNNELFYMIKNNEHDNINKSKINLFNNKIKLYDDYYKKILNSLNKNNKILDFIISIIMFYVYLHHVISVNINFSELYNKISNNNSNSNSSVNINNNSLDIISNLATNSTNSSLTIKLIDYSFKNNSITFYFPSFVYYLGFLDFFSYVDSNNTNEKNILFYVIASFIIIYSLFIFIINQINFKRKLIYVYLYYIHLLLTKVLAIPIFKTLLIAFFEFLIYHTIDYNSVLSSDSIINNNNNNTYDIFINIPALLGTLSILSNCLFIYFILNTEKLFNDLRILGSNIPYCEFLDIKINCFLSYIFITTPIEAMSTILNYKSIYNDKTNIAYQIVHAIPYLCLIKSVIIIMYIVYDIKYPFFINTKIKYLRSIDRNYNLILDGITSLFISILIVLYSNFVYILNFNSFVIIMFLTVMLVIVQLLLIKEKELSILKSNISIIKDPKTAMCFTVLFWNLILKQTNLTINTSKNKNKSAAFNNSIINSQKTFYVKNSKKNLNNNNNPFDNKFQYSDNNQSWIINYQFDMHRSKCYDTWCICNNPIITNNSISFKSVKAQLDLCNSNNSNNNSSSINYNNKKNLFRSLTKNYFNTVKTDNNKQIELINSINFNPKEFDNEYDEFDFISINYFIAYQKFFFILLNVFNTNFKQFNSYFIYIQAYMLIYLSKCYYQGIQKFMVLENNINNGFNIVKNNYYLFKEHVFNYMSTYLFKEEDTINIKKITKYEKYYDFFLEDTINSYKLYHNMFNVIGKSEVNEKECYLLAKRLIIQLEDVHKKYNIINSIINNEIKSNKILSMIYCSIIDSSEVAHYYYNLVLNTINTCNNLINKQNSFFVDNQNPGILCFSGNLTDLATIKYCNKKFYKMLNNEHEDLSLLGTNVNNIMHELFAKHHDYFILNFYRTNVTHNIDNYNIVYAQSFKNYLVPLKLLVKVLPSLEKGIYYVGYSQDLNTLNKIKSNKFNEAYLIFNPDNGYVYSFDICFKTLFDLSTEYICVNSNNNAEILNVDYLFKNILLKTKKNEIINDSDFEVEIDFNAVTNNFNKYNIGTERRNNDVDFEKVVNLLKSLKRNFTVIANVTKVSIQNGIINYAVLKLKIQSLYLFYNKLSNYKSEQNNLNSSINSESIVSHSIPKPSIDIMLYNNNISVKDIKNKTYSIKLSKLSTFNNKTSSMSKLAKYQLFSFILIIAILFVFLALQIKEIYDYSYDFNALIDNSNNLSYANDVIVNTGALMIIYYNLKQLEYLNKEPINSICYDDKKLLLNNILEKYFSNIDKVKQISLVLSEINNKNNENIYNNYYQFNNVKLENEENYINIDYTKTNVSNFNIIKFPLNDLNRLFNILKTKATFEETNFKSKEKEDLNINNKKLSLIIKEIYLQLYYNYIDNLFSLLRLIENYNIEQFDIFFKDNYNKIISTNIILGVIFIPLYFIICYSYYLHKKHKNVLVECLVLCKDDFVSRIELSLKIEKILNNIDNSKNHMNILHPFFRDEKSINDNIVIENNSINNNNNSQNQNLNTDIKRQKNNLVLSPDNRTKNKIDNYNKSLKSERVKKTNKNNSLETPDNSELTKLKQTSSIEQHYENNNNNNNNSNDKINNTINKYIYSDNNSIIKKTINLPYSTLFYYLLYLLLFFLLLIITTYLYIEEIKLFKTAYIVKENINLIIYNAKIALINKKLYMEGFNISKDKLNTFSDNLYIYKNKIENQYRIVGGDATSDILSTTIKFDNSLKAVDQLESTNKHDFIKKKLDLLYNINEICNFNSKCCNINYNIDKGLYSFLYSINKLVVNDYFIESINKNFDILFLYLYDFFENVQIQESNMMREEVNAFLPLFKIKITIYSVWLLLLILSLAITYYKFIQHIKREEKIISIIPKTSLYNNDNLIKLIKNL